MDTRSYRCLVSEAFLPPDAANYAARIEAGGSGTKKFEVILTISQKSHQGNIDIYIRFYSFTVFWRVLQYLFMLFCKQAM